LIEVTMLPFVCPHLLEHEGSLIIVELGVLKEISTWELDVSVKHWQKVCSMPDHLFSKFSHDITVAHKFYSGSVSSSDCRNSSQLLLDQRSSPFERRRGTCGQEQVSISSSAVHFFFLLTWVPIRMGLGMLFFNEQSLAARF
jgi:hypothetical protein